MLLVTLIVTGRSVKSDRVVNVCSWGEYIDEELITRFEEETGIRVNYQTAESNEACIPSSRWAARTSMSSSPRTT